MRSLVRPALMSLTVSLLLLSVAATAMAMPAGLRGGFSSDPDQFLFGGQIEPDPIADNNLYIIPSGEVGLGDDLFSLSFNGDFQYRFDVSGSVRPFAGMGVALWWVDPDNGGDSDTEFGVNALGGIFFGNKYPMFLELKLGLTDDIPDLKLVYGINFL